MQERKMSKKEKNKEKRLKKKYDDSDMKASMKKQYGKDWKTVYYATIRKRAMEQANEGYQILPPIDKKRYTEIPGMEGPMMTRSGKVVYYDPKEGSYYDRDTDMYLSYEEWKELDEGYEGDVHPSIDFTRDDDELNFCYDCKLISNTIGEIDTDNEETDVVCPRCGSQAYVVASDEEIAKYGKVSEDRSMKRRRLPGVDPATGPMVPPVDTNELPQRVRDPEPAPDAPVPMDMMSPELQKRFKNKRMAPPIPIRHRQKIGMERNNYSPEDRKRLLMQSAMERLQTEGEAGDHDRMYKVVHVKKGVMDIKAKTSYEAAKKFAKEKGLKSTAGVDTYLYPLEEGVAKFYDEYDTPVNIEVTDDKLLYNGKDIKMYNWSIAQSMLTPQMYKNAKSWDDVHAYLKSADDKGQLHQAIRATFETNPENITTEASSPWTSSGKHPEDMNREELEHEIDIFKQYKKMGMSLSPQEIMRMDSLYDYLDTVDEKCRYCGGDCPNDEENACDGYLGDIDNLYGTRTDEANINTDFYKNMIKGQNAKAKNSNFKSNMPVVTPSNDKRNRRFVPAPMPGMPGFGTDSNKNGKQIPWWMREGKINEGYEGEVSAILQALDIEHHWSDGHLHVNKRDIDDVRNRLADTDMDMPSIKVYEGKNKMGPQGMMPGDRVEHEGDMYEVVDVSHDPDAPGTIIADNLETGLRNRLPVADVTKLYGMDAMTDQDKENAEAMFKRLKKAGSGSLKHVATEGKYGKKKKKKKYETVDIKKVKSAVNMQESTDSQAVAEYIRINLNDSHDTWEKVNQEVYHVIGNLTEGHSADPLEVYSAVHKRHMQQYFDHEMSIKENIDKLRDIVKDKSAMSIKFADGSMKVDMTTANIFVQMYDKMKEGNQKKIDDMMQTKAGFLKVLDFFYGAMK